MNKIINIYKVMTTNTVTTALFWLIHIQLHQLCVSSFRNSTSLSSTKLCAVFATNPFDRQEN
jgi:hypothetical protein